MLRSRKAALLIIAGVFGAVWLSQFLESTPSPPADQIKSEYGALPEALVQVGGEQGVGSGVVVRNYPGLGLSLVATAWHVADPYCELFPIRCENLWVQHASNHYEATPAIVDEANDIALLLVEDELSAVQLGEIPPVGSGVTAHGWVGASYQDYPGALWVADNWVGCTVADCLTAKVRVDEGFSGGALVNESDELIGILVTSSGETEISTATSVEVVRGLIDSFEQKAQESVDASMN